MIFRKFLPFLMIFLFIVSSCQVNQVTNLENNNKSINQLNTKSSGSNTVCITQYDYDYDIPRPYQSCLTCQYPSVAYLKDGWGHCTDVNYNENEPYITDTEYYPHGKDVKYNSYKFGAKGDINSCN